MSRPPTEPWGSGIAGRIFAEARPPCEDGAPAWGRRIRDGDAGHAAATSGHPFQEVSAGLLPGGGSGPPQGFPHRTNTVEDIQLVVILLAELLNGIGY